MPSGYSGTAGIEQPAMIGQKFNRLLVLSYDVKKSKQMRRDCYLCRCDCGIEKVMRGISLRKERAKSCGCLAHEMAAARLRGKSNPNSGRKITWRLSPDAQALVEKCNKLVPFIANKHFSRFGEEHGFGDLICAGNFGLMSAAHWYLERDEEPCKFVTFAYPRIMNLMVILIKKHGKPNPHAAKLKTIRRLYYQRTGRTLDDYDLAKLAGIPVFEVQEILRSTYSLDEPCSTENESRNTLGDLIPDKNSLSPLSLLEIKEEVAIQISKDQRKKVTEVLRLKKALAGVS